MVFGKVFLKDGRQVSCFETADKAVAKVIVKPDDELLLIAFAALRTFDMCVDAVVHETGFAKDAPDEGDFFLSRR